MVYLKLGSLSAMILINGRVSGSLQTKLPVGEGLRTSIPISGGETLRLKRVSRKILLAPLSTIKSRIWVFTEPKFLIDSQVHQKFLKPGLKVLMLTVSGQAAASDTEQFLRMISSKVVALWSGGGWRLCVAPTSPGQWTTGDGGWCCCAQCGSL